MFINPNVCGQYGAYYSVPPRSQLYKWRSDITPYPFPEDVFAHFTTESAGNFAKFMSGETGAKSMPWKDVSGQNNHATVYGLPKLVWDDTFPDGVKRKAVHFGPYDSMAFPDQSELGYDYSVFAVAGYRKRQDAGMVFEYIGSKKEHLQRHKGRTSARGGKSTPLGGREMPYSFTLHFDLTANSHLDKRVHEETRLPIGPPALLFAFGEKSYVGSSNLRGRVPAMYLKPLNDTLIIIDGDRHNSNAGCSIVNFPMKKQVHFEIQIQLKGFVVKLDGETVCHADRHDRSQTRDLLTQNAKGIFLHSPTLLLGGKADAFLSNFKVTANADVGTFRRIFQAEDQNWYVYACWKLGGTCSLYRGRNT